MRVRLWLIGLCLLLSSSVSWAQHQRLGIAAQTISLAPRARQEVEAFCFDQHLYAPRTATPYTHVLSGTENATVRVDEAPPIPLSEAIQRGLVNVKGRGAATFGSELGLAFENASGRRLTI